MSDERHSTVMVVGGGIGGITAAVEIAELGYEVILVEKAPSLGGRVARMTKYFPKLCPPYCGLEINCRRIKTNKNVRVFTLTEIQSISGKPGNLEVRLKVNPRYVLPNHEGYERAIEACEVEVDDEYNLDMKKAKAIRYYNDFAYPFLPFVEASKVDDPGVKAAIEASGCTGFDLDQKTEELNLKVGAIVWATGWRPFDASRIPYLGFGKSPDIITNAMMERLCAVDGPTGGKLLRPSDGREAKKVAFVQCAGSRDENYLPYCSAVCCMASLKQATYVRERVEDSEAWIFYIDIRSGRYEDFMETKIRTDENIHLVKGRAGSVEPTPDGKNIIVKLEDIEAGKIKQFEADLVVLATGMVPNTAIEKIPFEDIEYDENDFVVSDPKKTGIFPIGTLKNPSDVSTTVQDATGVAIKAIHTILGR